MSVAQRALEFARALPDHALLDRIIRGRAWIPLLGVMLAGIVAMQVENLKLGASMGRSIERSTALQSRNELLRASVASLADDQRIEGLAAQMGMVMPAPDAVTFLVPRQGGNVAQAVAGIHQPDAASFIAQLPASASAATNTSSGATTAVGANSATSSAGPSAPTGGTTSTSPATVGTSPSSSGAAGGGATTAGGTTTGGTTTVASTGATSPSQTGATSPSQTGGSSQPTAPATVTPTGTGQPAASTQASGVSGGVGG